MSDSFYIRETFDHFSSLHIQLMEIKYRFDYYCLSRVSLFHFCILFYSLLHTHTRTLNELSIGFHKKKCLLKFPLFPLRWWLLPPLNTCGFSIIKIEGNKVVVVFILIVIEKFKFSSLFYDCFIIMGILLLFFFFGSQMSGHFESLSSSSCAVLLLQ